MFSKGEKYSEYTFGSKKNTKSIFADIDESQGAIITKIRDKIIDLEICPSTKNKALQAIRTALDYVYERNYLKGNYKDRVKNTYVETNGTDYLTWEEINGVLAYLNDNTDKEHYERSEYLISALAATTGLRPGELMAIKPTDLYMEDKERNLAILYINHSINTDGQYSTRKNKKGVYVATELSLSSLSFFALNRQSLHSSKSH